MPCLAQRHPQRGWLREMQNHHALRKMSAIGREREMDSDRCLATE